MNNVDYIIAGQGIAGTTMALRMLDAGLSIRVFDPCEGSSSSLVAAGVVNPITGRKLVKSWRIDELLPEVESLYRRFGELLDTALLHPMPIYKLLQSAGDQNDWIARRKNPAWQPYMSEVRHPDWDGVMGSHGIGTILNGWWLDVERMVLLFREYLRNNGLLLENRLEPERLEFGPDGCVSADGIKARAVIFCEGFSALDNPYFEGLPLSYAKGEIMTVRCPGLSWLDGILNRNGFIIPVGGDIFRVGATFNRDDNSPEPTEAGKRDLQRRFERLVDLEYEILEVRAGFRPTSADRRPVIGASPVRESIYIFNGLGTKGVSLSAYFSKHLLEHLEQGVPLDPEADLRRFISA